MATVRLKLLLGLIVSQNSAIWACATIFLYIISLRVRVSMGSLFMLTTIATIASSKAKQTRRHIRNDPMSVCSVDKLNCG